MKSLKLRAFLTLFLLIGTIGLVNSQNAILKISIKTRTINFKRLIVGKENSSVYKSGCSSPELIKTENLQNVDFDDNSRGTLKTSEIFAEPIVREIYSVKRKYFSAKLKTILVHKSKKIKFYALSSTAVTIACRLTMNHWNKISSQNYIKWQKLIKLT